MQFHAVPLLRMLLTAALVGPALTFAVLAAISYDAAFDRAAQVLDRRASLLAEHSLRVFDSHQVVADRVTDLLRDGDGGAPTEQVLHERMNRFIATLPQVYSIWVLDAEGRLEAATAVYPAPRVDLAFRDYFQALRANPDLPVVASEIGRGAVDGQLFFAMAYPRRTADGRFNGVIAVSALPDYFANVFGRMLERAADAAVLVRADGAYLARFPAVYGTAEPPFPPLRPSSGLMQAIKEVSPDRGVFRTLSQADGRERVFAYRRLAPLPLYIAVGQQVDTLRAEWWQGISVFVPVVLAVTALLSGITWVALRRARSEAEALRQLQDALEQREMAAAALRRAQRLEAMGQLTGGVAHDFNNLLQVMAGGLNLLGKSQPEERRALILDSLHQALQRGQSLTRQLLSFARRQPLAPSPLRLDLACSRLELLLGQLLRADITLETYVPDTLPPVHVDAAELELALLNLGVNARDAMPGGGQLRIEAREVERPAADQEGPAGRFVALTVSDTGTGIPADVLDKVYEPFFTTKEPGKGTGLGLSQVYGFVRQSGGFVTIASRIGQGTAVTLHLPVATAALQPAVPPTPVPAAASTGPLRLLLVEDNPEIRMTTAQVLQDAGHAVLVAASGPAALPLLEEGPDLVISDIMLDGGMDGLELARTVRRNHPGLPVILVTGYSQSARLAVADGFPVLRKPYDFTELLSLAATLVQRARAEATPAA